MLIIISLVAAVILLLNLRFRGWTLPIVAVSLWLGTSILVGGLYPTLVQRFSVVPDEVDKEEEFVGYNIEATLAAYGLDDIAVTSFAASSALDRDDLDANQATIDNIRLWDPGVLTTTYKQLQNIKTYYDISDVDVDRYVVDGELTQVMVSGRELDEANVPGGGWVNEKLVYTHGFGAVVSPANSVTSVTAAASSSGSTARSTLRCRPLVANDASSARFHSSSIDSGVMSRSSSGSLPWATP